MQNKKLEWMRLGIYLLFANGLAWVPWLIIGSKYGDYSEWTAPSLALILSLTAFAPAAANVLTRLMTKEGWENSFLHLRLRVGGNVKYYLIGILFPLVCALIGGILEGQFVGGGFSTEKAFEGYTICSFIGVELFMIGFALSVAFYTFGEEFGWRGYMIHKLEKLMGTTSAVIVGGIIWGLWHAPLTVRGHNYGTGYWGFPWLGIVSMCAWGIGIGAMLMWITKKSGSVYPASISHAVLNFATMPLSNAMAALPMDLNPQENFRATVLYTIPGGILGMLFFVLLLLDRKKKTAVSPEIAEGAEAA